MKKLILFLLFISAICFSQENKLLMNNGKIVTFNGSALSYTDYGYSQEAKDYFARMSTQLTIPEKQQCSDFIDSLLLDVGGSVLWNKMNAMYSMAMPTEQQASLNLISNNFNLTNEGSSIFVPYFGFTGIGSSYLNTNFTASTDGGSIYTLNSASFGIRLDSIAISAGEYFGAYRSGPGTRTYICPTVSGNSNVVINSATEMLVSNTNINEFFIINRTLSTEQELYISKDKYTAASTTSVLIDYDMYLLARNNAGTPIAYSQENINFAFIGGGLTTAEVERLNDLVSWHIEAMRDLSPSPVGISPSNPAGLNTIYLQAALDGGNKTLNITEEGTYLINSTIFLDDNTTLNWSEGTYLQKDAAYSNVFINRGALIKERNYNIEINGLNLIVDNQEAAPEWAYGVRGQLGFFGIDGLTITNFTCMDVGNYQFAIYSGDWSDLLYDSLVIEGEKDAIKFLHGHDAIIKNCYFKTYDDATFIGGVDFPSIECESMGDVYNMSFTNINYSDSSKVYPARGMYMYLGSWADWTVDSTYQTGDHCVNSGNIYQVNNVAGFSAVAANAPIHTSGTVIGVDGISWHQIDTGNYYTSNIYNISIDSSFYYDPSNFITVFNSNSADMRNIYPGTERLASATDIRVSNTTISNTIALSQAANLIDITYENCTFDSLDYVFLNNQSVNILDSLYIRSINNDYINCTQTFIDTDSKRVFFSSTGDTYTNSTFVNSVTADGFLRANNTTLPFSTLANLTPVLNDTCLTTVDLYTWDGDSWELTP